MDSCCKVPQHCVHTLWRQVRNFGCFSFDMYSWHLAHVRSLPSNPSLTVPSEAELVLSASIWPEPLISQKSWPRQDWFGWGGISTLNWDEPSSSLLGRYRWGCDYDWNVITSCTAWIRSWNYSVGPLSLFSRFQLWTCVWHIDAKIFYGHQRVTSN